MHEKQDVPVEILLNSPEKIIEVTCEAKTSQVFFLSFSSCILSFSSSSPSSPQIRVIALPSSDPVKIEVLDFPSDRVVISPGEMFPSFKVFFCALPLSLQLCF